MNFFKRLFGSGKKDNKPPANLPSAHEFVARLEELGYYKYADPTDVKALKEEMTSGFDPGGELITIWDEEGTPKDYRYYACDGEDLYEEGGFTDKLNELKPTFDKLGLKINITRHFEEWDEKNKWLDHRITINGTKYIIFKQFKSAGWGQAAQRLAEILNTELERQGKAERVYLISGGNDGRLIFLTEELFRYIDSVYYNDDWKPFGVYDWCKAMGDFYMKVN
jgi:hypothetical protein